MPPTDTAPDVDWVRQRVLAERTPANAVGYTTLTSPYLLEVPNITQRIRDHLNQWNSEATESDLAADVDSGLATVMPKLGVAIITDQDVANWCERNGYPLPAGVNPNRATGTSLSMPMSMPMPVAPLRRA